MLPVSGEVYQQYVEKHKQLILAGHRPFDSSVNDNPVKFSDLVRVRKLMEIVGDLQRVLLHLSIDPEVWREADHLWRGSFLLTPEMTALHSLLVERIDVSEDVAAIAAAPPPTTRGLVEPGGTVVALGSRQILVAGYALRDGKAYLRTCDLLGRKVVWEGATALHPWKEPPPRRSFRVHGTRLLFAHERRLVSMKLLDGQDPWTVELPGSEAFPNYGEDLKLFHIPLGDAPGVIAIAVELPSSAQKLLAFDEDTGEFLWQIALSVDPAGIRVIPQVGLVVHTQRSECWATVYDARSGSVLTAFGMYNGQGSGWVRRIDMLDSALLVYVSPTSRPYPDEFTLLAVDPRNGRLLEKVQRSVVEKLDTLLIVDHRPLWLRWREKAKGLLWLERYSDAHARPPEDRWERWVAIDDLDRDVLSQAEAIVTDEAIVIAYHVTVRTPELMTSRGVLRFLDRRTLALTRELRCDQGLALKEQGRETLAARGNLLAFRSVELSVLDIRTGEILWAMPLPSWRSHRFLGAWLLVTTRTGWLVIHPETGTVVATWPLDP
jgi:hypothetical protein